jgi:hypothetical protein
VREFLVAIKDNRFCKEIAVNGRDETAVGPEHPVLAVEHGNDAKRTRKADESAAAVNGAASDPNTHPN